jgi:hypothetical protein
MISSHSIVSNRNDFMIYEINMQTILLSMVSWLCVNVITRASGKLGLSKTYVSVGLCILIWIVLYVGQLLIQKYTVQREQIVAFVWGAYWTSQCVYNLYQKFIEKGE